MSDNGKKPAQNMSLGEISTIRDILMGQQMNEYDSKFAELEAKLADAVKKLESQLSEGATKTTDEAANMEKRLQNQISDLEKDLTKQLTQLDNKLQQTSKKDKAKIGKMLSDMGRKLMED